MSWEVTPYWPLKGRVVPDSRERHSLDLHVPALEASRSWAEPQARLEQGSLCKHAHVT